MNFFKKFTTKKWWVYCIRWMTSGLIIAPVTSLFLYFGFPVWVGVTAGNITGAAFYVHFDEWLLVDKRSKYKILNWLKEKIKQ
jgi:hypothetical protein